jgi:hypothetical protein
VSDLHRILHSAYTLVRSTEVNKATASLTLDHLLHERLRGLKRSATRSLLDGRGEAVGSRASRLDELDRLQKDITETVRAVREAGDDPDRLRALGVVEEA